MINCKGQWFYYCCENDNYNQKNSCRCLLQEPCFFRTIQYWCLWIL